MELPSPVAIEYLHRRLAGSEDKFEVVFIHCKIVWAVARQLIVRHYLQLDADLVRTGALLHDIGAYSLEPDEPYIRHGVVGAWMLRKQGFPETICRFASLHTGAGITKQDIEREKLSLPLEDFVPEMAEECLVAYADKFHSKTDPPRFNSVANIRKDLGKHGEDKVARFDDWLKRFGEPDLKVLAEQFGHKIV
jgi:uncharacterized protein